VFTKLPRARTAEFFFVLKGRNGQVLVTSETYDTKQSAEAGIRSVRGTATVAQVIHTTN
jgi:uncharacterized protein YegP (UPF0339 family)